MMMADRYRRLLRIVAILAVVGSSSRSEASEPRPEFDRLKAHVERLASPEFAGRRGEGAAKAAAYLVEQFRALKLAPLFDGQYEQEIPGKEPDEIIGRNVGACLTGSDPKLRDQWIIVSAHFDHLGIRDGRLYPGADDNASGVAMMLEVARCLTRSPERPRRSIMFVGYDLEENGLWGSRYFVEHPPIPLSRIALFVTADMIARSLGGVCDAYVFAMGTEHCPALRPWVKNAAKGEPVKIGLVGSDLLFFDRSDYGPFRARSIPYLFFSTGENPRYHTPNDTPETLNFKKLTATSRIIHDVIRQAAMADNRPAWLAEPDHPFAEAVAIREVLQILLDHSEQLKMKPVQMRWISGQLKTFDEIIERGKITPSERTRMVRIAQIVLYTVL